MDSNICALRFGLGIKGGLSVGGAPKMHYISGLSQFGHLHLGRQHVQGSMRVWCCQVCNL